MWTRNLLFIGVAAGGVLVLAGSLRPLHRARAQVLSATATLPADEEQTAKHFDALNHTLRQMESIRSAAKASDLAILRRLHLALLGTIPSIEEIRRFEQIPPADRIQTWLAHLFEDRRHADYFAERLARAYVGTEDGPFIIFRRRRFVTWLSDELHRNQPYDAIVRSLIADEGLWTEKPATNFVTVTFQEDKNGFNPERLASRVSRAFLGVRLDCAQCHDHPFQPWKQIDFMGLAAYFGQVERGFTGLYENSAAEFNLDRRKNGHLETVSPKVPFAEECLHSEGSRRHQLAAWITDPENRWFARATVNRIWTLLLGKPLVEPVDDIPSVGEPPQTLDLLADDFAKHGFNLRRLIRIIVATEVFQFDSSFETEVTPDHEKLWAVFPLTRLRPEQVVGGIMQTGSLETLDAESPIVSRFLAFVGGKDFVQRYGDTGEDEFNGRGGTIPQRLLVMNGNLVEDKTNDSPFNAATRVGMLAPDDRSAVDTAYLAVLTRRPTAEEDEHFRGRLAGTEGKIRHERMGDLYWTLLNSTEFSWNH